MLQTEAAPGIQSEHTHTATRAAPEFSADELEAIREQDRHAARIVSGLLAGIFTMGLGIYTYIWWLVAN